jgi:hypothetical protein
VTDEDGAILEPHEAALHEKAPAAVARGFQRRRPRDVVSVAQRRRRRLQLLAHAAERSGPPA